MKKQVSISPQGKAVTTIFFLLFAVLSLSAQPSWVKKATKSVFTLKTFNAEGSLVGSSNGFFVGTDGEAVSNFIPFKGASLAVIIDAAGKEIPVVSILGANDMYDVVRFRVASTKTPPLANAASTAAVGSTVWLLPYHETKNIQSGVVRKAEQFLTDFSYYTIALPAQERFISSPLLNENGEVIGLLQPSASAADTLCYAICAQFADSLRISGLSLNDPSLRQTRIKAEIPDNISDATLMLYIASSASDSTTYASLIDDFIKKYPTSPDGYNYRAQLRMAAADFAAAEQEMELAIKTAEPKDAAHFNYARLIYNKEIYQGDKPYANWSLDKALAEIQEAYSLNPQPSYRLHEANILFGQKEYAKAHDLFIELTKSELSKPELWYGAARCKEMLKDTTAMLALLDSTLSTFSKPYLKEAAPYLWHRASARMDAGKYRDAITDLNDYEQLMSATLSSRFYYIRHQAEIGGRLYQQALNDINQAIQMEPTEPLYLSEKASLEIRVGLYDDALKTANDCIALAPDASDGYLFLGLVQCLKGNKKEGVANLQKAKQLGDPQADDLIEKYAGASGK